MGNSTTKPADGSDKPEKAAGWRASKFPIPISYAKAQAVAPVPPQAKGFVAGLTAEQTLEEPATGAEEAESPVGLFKAMEPIPAEAAGPSPTAVLVFHGMGQQVRFQTLSDLASAILDEAEEQNGTVNDVQVKLAPKVGKPGQFLARVELVWEDAAGTPHEAHIYEAYWAPLTAGKVKYWDTIKFLMEGGKNGLFSIIGGGFKFQRWVFGDFRSMRITRTTPFALLTIMLVLGFTVAMIAMALSAVGDIAHHLSSPKASEVFKTVLDAIYTQIASPWDAFVGWVGKTFSLCLCGLLLPAPGGHIGKGAYAGAVLAWCALIGLALFLRFFLTEYAGSVAAYLAPYKDSKFEKLRGDIQKVGLDAARLIYYGSRDPAAAGWIPDYKKIVIVGHSLGTVIAYDTLNAIFNIEQTSVLPGVRNTAVERTRALITFGSPLDKSAFIFRAQFKRGTTDGKLREIAACAFQPLISDLSYRYDPIRKTGPGWINLWSRKDIISGSLGYYDDPDDPRPPDVVNLDDPAALQPHSYQVLNLNDPACTIPFYAHVQYWKGKLLPRVVYNQLL